MKTTIAIAGNGCAAVRAVESIRRVDAQVPITVFSQTASRPYNPMLLTYLLADKVTDRQFYLTAEDFYRKHRVELVCGGAITQLRAREKHLTLADGSDWQFDRALIATGSSAVVPPVAGCNAPNVFTLRTLEGAQGLRAYLSSHPVKKALVIGASMIGIKAVEFFHQAGVECCLADGADRLFPLAACTGCASMMRHVVEQKGVRLRLSAWMDRLEVDDQGKATRVHFRDGLPPEEADVVLLCLGVRAQLDFVDPAELSLQQGLLVDQRMQTSVPGIYAAGDCAQGNDLLTGESRVIGLLDNARLQGQTAGYNLAGKPCVYGGTMPHNITRFMGMIFAGIGDPEAEGSVVELSRPETSQYLRVVFQGDRIVGANLLNHPELSGLLKSNVSRLRQGGTEQGLGYAEFTKALFERTLRV